MITSNEYAKEYKTTRRLVNDEQYKLILFPEDNTISVVKAKSVHPSDQPNFVVVLAGTKKYKGIVLHEGLFKSKWLINMFTHFYHEIINAQLHCLLFWSLFCILGDLTSCSEAADRQKHQDVNPEIESDYERESNGKKDEKQSNVSASKID